MQKQRIIMLMGNFLLLITLLLSASTSNAATMAEVDPMLETFLAYSDATVASSSQISSLMQMPYAANALGTGIRMQLQAEESGENAQQPSNNAVSRFKRMKNALSKGTEVLAALQRDFLPPAALPWLLQAHRLSIGTQQEHHLVSRLFRHLLANRYPVRVLWKALQYSYSMFSIISFAQRPDLNPHFLIWEIKVSDLPQGSPERAELEKLQADVSWLPHDPDQALLYALIMAEHGHEELAWESAQRYCRTGSWGEQALHNYESLADLWRKYKSADPVVYVEKSETVSPEGISQLQIEISPPLENTGEGTAPSITRELNWNGTRFVSNGEVPFGTRDAAAFLVEQALLASPAAFLPEPRKDYHQVRLTIERPGKEPVQYWSQLGPNRWIMPLFVAVAGKLGFINNPDVEWAMLSVLHRNTFLDSIYPKFSADYTPKPPGRNLSLDFIASAGITELPPQVPFKAENLPFGVTIKQGNRLGYWPPGLDNPVVLECLHGKRKGSYMDPRSSFSFYRWALGSTSCPLPDLSETLTMRNDLQNQLFEISGRDHQDLHIFPQVEYEMGETFYPQQRQFAGYCAKAGIPAGYSAHLLVKLLRTLSFELPESGSFPVPWKFTVNYREPDLQFSGYWLDFSKTMVITELKASGDGVASSPFNAPLRLILSASDGPGNLPAKITMKDGFLDNQHNFSINEDENSDWQAVAMRLASDSWQYKRDLSGSGKSFGTVSLTPPAGMVFFFLKQTGQPLQLRITQNFAPSIIFGSEPR